MPFSKTRNYRETRDKLETGPGKYLIKISKLIARAPESYGLP
jgi:hypothetical protein